MFPFHFDRFDIHGLSAEEIEDEAGIKKASSMCKSLSLTYFHMLFHEILSVCYLV